LQITQHHSHRWGCYLGLKSSVSAFWKGSEIQGRIWDYSFLKPVQRKFINAFEEITEVQERCLKKFKLHVITLHLRRLRKWFLLVATRVEVAPNETKDCIASYPSWTYCQLQAATSRVAVRAQLLPAFNGNSSKPCRRVVRHSTATSPSFHYVFCFPQVQQLLYCWFYFLTFVFLGV
jgi:hypothetical protein